MRVKSDIEEIKQRQATVKTWVKRLERMQKKGLSNTSFCRKYDLNLQWLSRAKNMNPLPSPKKIAEVEKAFKKEGV